MAEVVVTYKDQTLLSQNASFRKKLDTKGLLCEDDIHIEYNQPAGPTYEDPVISVANNGVVTASANGKSSTHTLSSTDDSDFIPSNIKTGVTIFGQLGTFTSDANAAATDILASKTAYVNGLKITGSIATRSDSGNTNLVAQGASKSFPAGYYPNSHGAVVVLPEQAGGDVTLSDTVTSKTYAAGYYAAAHTVDVALYAGSVSDDT